ncbi:hypothetical protein KJ969_05320, partial [Patescibacteria group bacterium]|nr:hypothetical protein [Patescibacteria group bacterium]
YNKKLEEMKLSLRRKLSGRVSRLAERISAEYGVPGKFIEVDKRRLRVLTAPWIVEEIAGNLKEKGFKPALVWEYPTWDALITQLEYL